MTATPAAVPPRSPRRRAAGRLTVLGLVAIMGAAACSDDDAPAAVPAVGSSGSTTAATSVPTSTTVAAASTASRSPWDSIPELVEEVQPSVVTVRTAAGEGSGVVYRADGAIVTNNHVVAGATTVEIVFADGEEMAGQVLATDPLVDLAVVRVDRGGLPAARFSTSLPRVGELAIALGDPLGFENSVTAGIVSGLHRSIPDSASLALVDLIQTDAAISPGNSGGALVNARGQVIGVNVAYIPPSAGSVSIGFAIPAATVVDTVDALLADGTARHAYVGIRPATITAQLADQLDLDVDDGVAVFEVVPGGPAELAGIRVGDVIVELDGEDVGSAEDFLTSLRQHDPGDRVSIQVVRGSETVEVDVVLSDRPD